MCTARNYHSGSWEIKHLKVHRKSRKSIILQNNLQWHIKLALRWLERQFRRGKKRSVIEAHADLVLASIKTALVWIDAVWQCRRNGDSCKQPGSRQFPRTLEPRKIYNIDEIVAFRQGFNCNIIQESRWNWLWVVLACQLLVNICAYMLTQVEWQNTHTQKFSKWYISIMMSVLR